MKLGMITSYENDAEIPDTVCVGVAHETVKLNKVGDRFALGRSVCFLIFLQKIEKKVGNFPTKTPKRRKKE